MIVYCQYSGTNFEVPNFPSMKLEAIHPLFYASTKQLLSRTGDWAAGKLNEQERKIMFLSLLHHTELVEFRVTAAPADSVVQQNMENLIRFVGWMTGIQNPRLSLPRFVVSQETREMGNVRYWLQAWWDARKAFEDGYVTTGQLARLRNREVALQRMIKNAAKKTEDYAGMLGAWACDATSVDEKTKEYWLDLFRLKGVAIYNARTVDLEEMLEHLEENLEHGSIYAATALKHVRSLLGRNKAGLTFGLGMDDDDSLDPSDAVDNPYRIVEDDVETYNKEVIAATAPVDEPVAKNYPSKLAYLRAKAAWQLAVIKNAKDENYDI